ncbi:MAG: hypothetical protein AAB677_00780 [Patescibacteria group bacterium]
MKKYIFFAGLIFILIAARVSAAAPDFTLQPAKVEITMRPGESTQRELTVINNGHRPTRVNLMVEDFKPGVSPAEPVNLIEPEVANPYSLFPYLTLPVRALDLAPGQATTVPVVISLPVAIGAAGGLYGAVIFSFAPIGEENQWTAARSRLGALIFIKTAGVTVREIGKLASFGLLGGQMIEAKQIPTFYLNYTNQGNVHLNPYGGITLTNRLTGAKNNLAVDPWFVLPDSSRIREIISSTNLSAGWYRAELKLNRGYADLIDEQSISFFVWSWLALAEIGFGLAAVLFLVFKLRRYFRGKIK